MGGPWPRTLGCQKAEALPDAPLWRCGRLHLSLALGWSLHCRTYRGANPSDQHNDARYEEADEPRLTGDQPVLATDRHYSSLVYKRNALVVLPLLLLRNCSPKLAPCTGTQQQEAGGAPPLP